VTVSTPATSALLGVYSRVGPLFTSGDGCELISSDGTRYLDFVAGIAVNALGYNHLVLRDAVTRALESGLVHVSNLYHTEPGERLAEFLVERSFAQQVFFCNSGAEANEAAFKFARKWSGGSKPGIIAFTGSFHGRLFASLAATDRPDFRRPFEPLVPGVRILPLYDEAELEEALGGGGVGAVIIEPVQGEGGVRPVEAGWLEVLRALCDRHGAALIFDEVQCGLGRTGTLFAYEQAGGPGGGGIAPDLLTLAKPLAGGLPMGAVLVTERIAAALAPGDHATTFGGGPFVATIALEVLKTIAEPAFLRAVVLKGDRLGAGLRALAGKTGRVRSARGRGLMWGLELSEAAAPIVAAARERQLLVASAGPNVLRLVPPLIVSESEIDRAVGILGEILA
jgi:acetylornithine/N-succinyldiaminopimelate aminotransferase